MHNLTLEEVGADNALALSDDGGETWKCRRATREARFESGESGTWLRSMWYPWSDVELETWLVPPTAAAPLWHLRIHRLRTRRALHSAEGACAIYGQREDGRALEPLGSAPSISSKISSNSRYGTRESAGSAFAISQAGASGLVELGSETTRKGQVIRTDANTNLMVPRAVLPTLLDEHQPSEKDVWFVTAVFGVPAPEGGEGAPQGWEAEWEKRPAVPREIAELIQ